MFLKIKMKPIKLFNSFNKLNRAQKFVPKKSFGFKNSFGHKNSFGPPNLFKDPNLFRSYGVKNLFTFKRFLHSENDTKAPVKINSECKNCKKSEQYKTNRKKLEEEIWEKYEEILAVGAIIILVIAVSR